MPLLLLVYDLALPPLHLSPLLASAGGRLGHVQSALHPGGPAAARIAWLWWVMFGAFAAVFVLVLVLTLLALVIRRRQGPRGPGAAEGDTRAPASEAEAEAAPPLGRTGFIVAGGIILPVVVLVPLLFYSLEVSARLTTRVAAPDQDGLLTVEVVGHRWWWEVRYPEQGIVTANEIHVPAGEPVRLKLRGADVIHSFWVPSLHGKRDMIPGIPTEFWLQADEPGTYRGQCAEYCGTQHAKMAFLVVALPPDEFREWAELKQRLSGAAAEPQTDEQRRGLQVFQNAGCARCHNIKGVPRPQQEEEDVIGPDLTHVGSRRTLGAGTLPATRGNLAGWIGDPQAIKPGARMPAAYLAPGDLLSLAEYLEGRK